MARIVQHETDHLDGTLFIDRLSPTQLAAIRDKLEEFELVFRSRTETGEMPTRRPNRRAPARTGTPPHVKMYCKPLSDNHAGHGI